MDYVEHNRKHWNKYSKDKGPWSRPASKELIEKARHGEVEIFITTKKLVPQNWLPKSWRGLKVLGLASGGGQQIPLIAATGAEVTSYDLSEEQLRLDQETCEREGLAIKTIQGDMMNLQALEDTSFDLIINPVSTCFVSDVTKVWNECSRVLKPGGVLISGLNNPVVYAISDEDYDKNQLVLSRKLPYSDLETKTEDQIHEIGAAEFSHTLTTLIGDQLRAGFHITDFYEDEWGIEFNMIIDSILPQFFATRAVKF
jgi:SAM-dependent methyltransferase